jgi:cytochrome P450
LGAPTLLIKDDEYEGYRFPAGTVFTWNAWYMIPMRVNFRAIALSEKEYDEPLRYKPERFLDKDLNNALAGHWGFGPGSYPIYFLKCQEEEFVLDGMLVNKICG